MACRYTQGGALVAILKHITIKNSDYGAAQRYLVFQHDEYTNKSILDESGRLVPREEYYLDGVNCDPFHFDDECMELNARYKKNQKKDEIKSYHYIISFDPEDVTENGLTGEKAQQLGLAISPDIRPLSAPIQTDITKAEISMSISLSTVYGNMMWNVRISCSFGVNTVPAVSTIFPENT